MVLHLEKKAIRALGIAESFSPKDEFSSLAAVVMRRDLVIDGFGFGRLRVAGSDATLSILKIYRKLERNDINAVLLSGSVLSLYNIVDVDRLGQELSLPVIALTFKASHADLARNIAERFDPKDAQRKTELLETLGKPQEVKLGTGYSVFVRTAKISKSETKKLLDSFTLEGSIPEPVRVAKLLSRALRESKK